MYILPEHRRTQARFSTCIGSIAWVIDRPMKSIPLLAFVLGAAVMSADARLGESLEQCETRYGKARETRKNVYGLQEYDFETDGVRIRAVMVDGKCGMVCYTKIPAEGIEARVLRLLRENVPGETAALKIGLEEKWTVNARTFPKGYSASLNVHMNPRTFEDDESKYDLCIQTSRMLAEVRKRQAELSKKLSEWFSEKPGE